MPTFPFCSSDGAEKQIQEEKHIATQPVIFNIAYTPYRLKKGSSAEDVAAHAKERAFYDMSGSDNIYKYITTERKILGEQSKKFTMLEYLQKSTGVFDGDGVLTKEQVKEMKERAQTGEKNIWHGFISFNEENSEKIDHPDKCIALVKKTFGEFFRDAGFDEKNIDLMCSLHLDKPNHLHVHFVFWEKEPKIKNERAAGYKYRAKGKIAKAAIDKMTERLNAYTIDDDLARKRDDAVDALYKRDDYSKAHRLDGSLKLLKQLADELPKDKPLWYGSKEIAPFRNRIDFVTMILCGTDPKLAKADGAFRAELVEKKTKLSEIMDGYYKDRLKAEMELAENYPNLTDDWGIHQTHTIEKLEWDYKRCLGNIVLKKIRYIQDNTYKRNPNWKYKTNDKTLKRNLAISDRKIKRYFDGFVASLCDLFLPETQNYGNRLKEIEEEMKARNAENEESSSTSTEEKPSKWNWSK